MQGHEKEALHLMSTYLPKETGPGSVYSEGGGLYALGEPRQFYDVLECLNSKHIFS